MLGYQASITHDGTGLDLMHNVFEHVHIAQLAPSRNHRCAAWLQGTVDLGSSFLASSSGMEMRANLVKEWVNVNQGRPAP